MALMPGAERWLKHLEALLAHPGPLWVFGPPGSGVSTVGAALAARRGSSFLDEAEHLHPGHPDLARVKGSRLVLGSHLSPEDPDAARVASHCLPVRLASLEEAPGRLPAILKAIATEEGLEGEPPAALLRLPCPGELRGLRNRVIRFRLMGELPAQEGDLENATTLPLEREDLASNLHVLERLLLHRALRRSYGSRVEAAQRLGISRRQLYLLIQRHGDPVRGEAPVSEGPKRLQRQRQSQNSSRH